MKIIKLFLLLFIVFQFAFICYANRALYTSHFDHDYWRDKYDHSQWKLLYSNRPIGDDGLYLYEGYRLIHGGDPTTFNAEMPPLGKYIIGISTALFGNGYVYGLIATSLALVACYFLFVSVTGSSVIGLALTALLITDPLIVEQFRLTMLDSLQLLFFCCFLGFLTQGVQSKKSSISWVWPMASGVSLGLFAATKFPMLAPVFALAALILIWKTHKAWMPIVVFVISMLAAYLVPYIPYFVMGNSFGDWMLVQKFMASFYLHSKLPPAFGSIFTTLIANMNKNLFSNVYERVAQWSPVWPLITVASAVVIITFFRNIRQKSIQWNLLPIIGSTCILLLFYSVIPFWTRYLIIVLPLLYLCASLLLQKSRFVISTVIFFVCIGINVFASIHILFPSPSSTLNQFTYDWQQGLFQDMYEAVSSNTKKRMSRDSFYTTGKQYFYDAQIEQVNITVPAMPRGVFVSSARVPIEITYTTRALGTIKETKEIVLVNERGQWKIDWQWDYIFTGLQPEYSVRTTIDVAKRGSMFTKIGNLLASDRMSKMIYIDPKKISPETEDQLFHALEEIFKKQIIAVGIHERYVRMSHLQTHIPIGVIMHPIDPYTEKMLSQYPEIVTAPAYGRMSNQLIGYDIGVVQNTLYKECCSLLYNTTSYEGATGLEKQYNDKLKGENGGSLVIVDQTGKIIQTIKQVAKRDGMDVKLDW